mmetsp:Transcript_57280/g.114940  ORF Transcript_57280/g.114940 Transcript_57280/m.114940 type:complete len:203 (-) Transcript_57280:610-1218(-)
MRGAAAAVCSPALRPSSTARSLSTRASSTCTAASSCTATCFLLPRPSRRKSCSPCFLTRARSSSSSLRCVSISSFCSCSRFSAAASFCISSLTPAVAAFPRFRNGDDGVPPPTPSLPPPPVLPRITLLLLLLLLLLLILLLQSSSPQDPRPDRTPNEMPSSADMKGDRSPPLPTSLVSPAPLLPSSSATSLSFELDARSRCE